MQKIAGMTGPEHFLAGEEAMGRSETVNWNDLQGIQMAAVQAAQAQAHFSAARTLAIGAMVAGSETGEAAQAWRNLLGIEAVDA